MKRSLKLALIPTAIAAALTANTAFAGSEACFEVYSVGDNLGVINHDVKYNAAACVAEADRLAATASDLEPTDSTSIAYELTGDYDAILEDINVGGDDLQIVYIPTTDIPSGTVINISLSGATWAENANQLHLVQDDGANFELVASSDGAFDGSNTVTFLTKAGVTIGAGTRLAFTTDNAVDGTANTLVAGIVSPTFNITNTACPTDGTVSLTAVTAVTDGGNGFTIEGGASTAQEIADISPQFIMFDAIGGGSSYTTGSASVVVEQVDAEDTNGTPRTIFVDDQETTSLDFVVDSDNAAVYAFRMVDRIGELDQAITITSADDVSLSFVSSVDAGFTQVGLYDTWATTGMSANLLPTNQIDINVADTGSDFVDLVVTGDTETIIELDGDDVFADNSNDAASFYTEEGTVNDNAWYATLEYSGADDSEVMNFNYDVSVKYSLDFSDSNFLDHCETTEAAFDIGVNGAVLKVPYTYDTSGNFIRITNEHSEEALITLDIFDESGNQMNSVTTGTVGEHASVVYLASDLIDLAISEGYMGTGNRHTMTFTVTAPKDSVHGVSVQKIPGGVDRVLPVLDTNIWQQ